MTTKISASADGAYGSLGVGANEAFRFGADNSGQLASFRNKLINGDFRIWQRGTSPTIPINAATFFADRWVAYNLGSIMYPYAPASGGFGVNGNVGNTSFEFSQRIESANVKLEAGKKYTVSIKVDSTAAFSLLCRVYSADAKDNFSAETLREQFSFSVEVGAKIYSVTFTATAEFANGIKLNFYRSNFTSGNMVVRYVQLEEGSIATPFEQRPIGLELSLCQRYYWRNTSEVSAAVMALGCVIATASANYFVQHPVKMRASPTIDASSGFGGTNGLGIIKPLSGPPTVSAASSNSTATYLIATNSLNDWVAGQPTALVAGSVGGYLGFSAEL
jgi:hypothetical protein